MLGVLTLILTLIGGYFVAGFMVSICGLFVLPIVGLIALVAVPVYFAYQAGKKSEKKGDDENK